MGHLVLAIFTLLDRELGKRRRRDVKPHFVPHHFLAVLRKLHVDDKLLSIPLEGTLVIGIHMTGCRTGIIAQHTAEAIFALVPPIEREEKNLSSLVKPRENLRLKEMLGNG